MGAESLLLNTPPTLFDEALLDMSTAEKHNVFYFRLQAASRAYFEQRLDGLEVRTLDPNTGKMLSLKKAEGDRKERLTIVKCQQEPCTGQLAKRFYPFNLMHVLHDDLLGAYALQQHWPSLRHSPHLHVADTFGDGPYDHVYGWLGHKLWRTLDTLAWKRLPGANHPFKEEYICWDDLVVGSGKDLSWYQYGYGKPQGPLPRATTTSGTLLRKVSLQFLQTIRKRLEEKEPHRKEETGECIAIFSRKSTRLILNEQELAKALSVHFKLPICWIRLEDNSVERLAWRLTRARYAFGMHGALLILAMFLPKGATLVEGFPYGVPADNYTPYKTMLQLPGMDITYHSWVVFILPNVHL